MIRFTFFHVHLLESIWYGLDDYSSNKGPFASHANVVTMRRKVKQSKRKVILKPKPQKCIINMYYPLYVQCAFDIEKKALLYATQCFHLLAMEKQTQ